MKYDFEKMFDRRMTSAKWQDMVDGIIPMTVADMDFPILPEVSQAVKDTADQRDFGYQLMKEHHYDAIRSWIKRRTGEDVPRKYLLDTP